MIDEAGEGGRGNGPGSAVDLTRLVARISGGGPMGGLLRRWRRSLASSAFVLIAPPPRYIGVAKVLLEDQESYFAKPDKAPGFEPGVDDRRGGPKPGRSGRNRESGAQGDRQARACGKRRSSATAPGGRRVVDGFLSRLTVFHVPRSRVMQIEFVSRDPELAARGADTVGGDLFARHRRGAKAEAGAPPANCWRGRSRTSRAKVADADAKVEALRSDRGRLAAANGEAVSAEPISDLDLQLANARSAEAAATAKADASAQAVARRTAGRGARFDRRRVPSSSRRGAGGAEGRNRRGVANASPAASADERTLRAARRRWTPRFATRRRKTCACSRTTHGWRRTRSLRLARPSPSSTRPSPPATPTRRAAAGARHRGRQPRGTSSKSYQQKYRDAEARDADGALRRASDRCGGVAAPACLSEGLADDSAGDAGRSRRYRAASPPQRRSQPDETGRSSTGREPSPGRSPRLRRRPDRARRR